MQFDTHLDALVKVFVLSAVDADFDINVAGGHCFKLY